MRCFQEPEDVARKMRVRSTIPGCGQPKDIPMWSNGARAARGRLKHHQQLRTDCVFAWPMRNPSPRLPCSVALLHSTPLKQRVTRNRNPVAHETQPNNRIHRSVCCATFGPKTQWPNGQPNIQIHASLHTHRNITAPAAPAIGSIVGRLDTMRCDSIQMCSLCNVERLFAKMHGHPGNDLLHAFAFICIGRPTQRNSIRSKSHIRRNNCSPYIVL